MLDILTSGAKNSPHIKKIKHYPDNQDNQDAKHGGVTIFFVHGVLPQEIIRKEKKIIPNQKITTEILKIGVLKPHKKAPKKQKHILYEL
jgi:ribosomal protein S3AE